MNRDVFRLTIVNKFASHAYATALHNFPNNSKYASLLQN